MDDLMLRTLLPSTGALLIGLGALLGVVGVVLVQMAVRTWLHQARARDLHDRVARAEARWGGAAT
jgi:hypothetical protein